MAGVTLLDLRRRFIFADEVGLGKTIEAGIVAHDLLMQNPNARILVVCPGALTYQWLSELYTKFGGYLFQVLDMHAETSLDFDKVRRAIVSTSRLLEGLANKVEGAAWDMVIIDEAHHLLSSSTLYAFAERVGAKAPSLLLLSAIPARRRKDEYLRLLRLIEPERYGGPDVVGAFDELYAAQPDIGRRLRILARRLDELHEDSAEEVVDAAQRLVGSPIVKRDAELAAMVAALPGSGDQLAVRARDILHLVADHYRISRRILRNRRERLVAEQQIAPIQRRLVRLEYVPEQLELDAEKALLTLFRGGRERGGDEALLFALARASLQSLASPTRLCATLATLQKAKPRALRAGDAERASRLDLAGAAEWWSAFRLLCEGIRGALDDDALSAALKLAQRWRDASEFPRLEVLVDHLRRGAAKRQAKVVIFAGCPELARELADDLRKCFPKLPRMIVEFRSELDSDQKEENLLQFRRQPAARVLVSDESGGEGRNFQFADELIHFDTPWHVSRIEQRIGRLDRIGREEYQPEVVSRVIVATGSLEDGLVVGLDGGLGVYTRSISGLEFALRDVEDRLAMTALDGGSDALRELVPEICDIAVEERAKDDSDAVLDESSFERRTAERFLRVRQSDATEESLEQAFTEYFRLLAPRAAQTFDDGTLDARLWKFDADAAQHGGLPLTKLGRDTVFRGTFRRRVAQSARPSVGFFNHGNPLFDAVINSLFTRSTGRVYAVSCKVPGHHPWVGFEFAFTAGVAPDSLHGAPGFANRARGLFSLRPISVLIRESGMIEEDPEAIAAVRRALDKTGKDRHWWNWTKEKTLGLAKVFRDRAWDALVRELYASAEYRARQLWRERLTPGLRAEFEQLGELERLIQRSAGSTTELLALRSWREALDAWNITLDSAGFLAINDAVPRDP
ncbi:SNF2-related protein [Sorangium sp. So ce388]|uniref:SNF2-related protein n=1 Tax=Sorangium sp. So ce388 TaxID=3133309 RepID=UPI003F5BBF74